MTMRSQNHAHRIIDKTMRSYIDKMFRPLGAGDASAAVGDDVSHADAADAVPEAVPA